MKEIAQKVSGGCRSMSGFQGSDPRRCDDITTLIMTVVQPYVATISYIYIWASSLCIDVSSHQRDPFGSNSPLAVEPHFKAVLFHFSFFEQNLFFSTFLQCVMN